MAGEYEVHYKGWEDLCPTKSNTCFEATRDGIFPNYRKCQLDVNLLWMIGLNKK